MNLSFVPPGGGETGYSLPIEMPEIPRADDYLSIMRSGQSGTENFIVKRTWWNLEFDDSKSVGSTSEVWAAHLFETGFTRRRRSWIASMCKFALLHRFDLVWATPNLAAKRTGLLLPAASIAYLPNR